ncbi:hypothetical protein EDI_310240 [Entamoeba dispar SAW760]|uniref:Uncharacterized protein n=1 Tax=Entamoeba dispar (strain ATCC PRA-260 / SAW760) TaxID=370354 RepID=B0ENV4_ENTDS|nr:uncharacterized protein EDI_310240 [Entamoeba dispar SAW760]EDR23793.1 hypothetical protein EDI_310240 [Entamoeba dispar SAW760]|eukprot:EDR23793.1 hypothetical protein EDI_310240 [Entamoeba dispar SAW760]
MQRKKTMIAFNQLKQDGQKQSCSTCDSKKLNNNSLSLCADHVVKDSSFSAYSTNHTPRFMLNQKNNRLIESRKWRSTNALPSPLRHCSPVPDDEAIYRILPPPSVSPGTAYADNEIASILSQSIPSDSTSPLYPRTGKSVDIHYSPIPMRAFDFNEDDNEYCSRCSNPGIFQ